MSNSAFVRKELPIEQIPNDTAHFYRSYEKHGPGNVCPNCSPKLLHFFQGIPAVQDASLLNEHLSRKHPGASVTTRTVVQSEKNKFEVWVINVPAKSVLAKERVEIITTPAKFEAFQRSH